MKRSVVAIAMGLGLGLASQAKAALVIYSGADDAVTSLADMTNASAASAAFDAAVTGATLVDFEGALPTGLTISGGLVTNDSGCGALCGINTTPGGRNFLYLYGGSATFTFANPIQAFGFYITGLQTSLVAQQTLTFSDGSNQTIDMISANGGGGAFLGFTNVGKSVTSLTYNATQDIVTIDDLRFVGLTTVPEPATWAMMLLGFGGMGSMLRASRRKMAQTA